MTESPMFEQPVSPIDDSVITALTNPEVDALKQQVQAEQERRSRLTYLPQQIVSLTQQYVADGGDAADVIAAIEQSQAPVEAPEPEPAS